MKSPLPVILVDSREQCPWDFSELHVQTQRSTLDTGDYTIAGASDLVVVERKSLEDLVQCSSWDHDRFCDQARRLGSQFPHRAIVVEASLADVAHHRYKSATTPASVIGTTIALLVDYGVPTIWAGGPRAAASWAERFLMRVWAQAEARRKQEIG